MKRLTIFYSWTSRLCLLSLFACGFCACVRGLEAGPPINELPMYGGVKKTLAQRQADEQMIKEAIRISGSREKASDYAAQSGWTALYKDDPQTAMKLFNQAWLLNPNNAQAYWGFGAILSSQGPSHVDEALKMTEKAQALDPSNPRIMADLAYSYADKARGMMGGPRQERDAFFQKSNALFEKASQLDPNYNYLYVQWAIALFYQDQYAAAWQKIGKAKSLGVTEQQLDPRFLNDLRAKMPEP